MIFETCEKLRQQEENTTKITKSIRGKKERRLLHQNNSNSTKGNITLKIEEFINLIGVEVSQKTLNIKPFDELEEV